MMTLAQRIEVEQHLRAVVRILDANSSVRGGEWRLDSKLADGRAVLRVFRIDGHVQDRVVKLVPQCFYCADLGCPVCRRRERRIASK